MKKNLPDPNDEREQMSALTGWTRRYAQNRVLPQLLFFGVFLGFFLAITVSVHFAGMARRAGNKPLFWACLIIFVLALIANTFCSIWFAVPRWGGRQIEAWARRCYDREGDVRLASHKSLKQKWVVYLVGFIFGASILTCVLLGFCGIIPQQSMQPVSALYTVPFLLFLYIWMRPLISPIALLWPLLYALHAILLVAGVPILFAGPWESLNMFLPVFGYGFLTMFLAHFYNRLALRRLKTLSRAGLSDENGVGDEGGEEKEPQS